VDALILLQWIFDTLTGLGLLWLAWRALASPQLFRAVMLFVAFGLLMALAWVRLDAPVIALAEVAIGAGLTGALLLAALARLTVAEGAQNEADQSGTRNYAVHTSRWLAATLLSLVAAGLVYSVLSFPHSSAGLSVEVAANLDISGVSNPVTAVLLNFRGYDTLLEMLVLLLALLGVWSLGALPPERATRAGLVLDTLTGVLTPVLILLAAYLLWVGASAPGGAFQAGAVLGAAGVLLLLAGWRPHPGFTQLPLRLVLVAGPGLFLVTSLVTIATGRHLLEYPPERAQILIVILEIAATLSIGTTLAALFLGERPHDKEGQ
jgi:multisubunit Na+/H+ antiporter MnhB subunit